METAQKIFEPIDVDSVSEAVVAQIEQLIISGVLKSGQKLPSERELAELTEVSRPKVRDAIKVLEDRGLVTVRHGDGTFIADLTGAALSPAMVDLYARHAEAFFDYLEFRRELEGYAAYLAARRATDHDRAIIGDIIARMAVAHEKADPTEEAELDVGLHAAIADAAHNSMLVHVMGSIYELMQRGIFYNREQLYRRPGGARDKLLAQHQAIAKGVLEGDPDAAAAAAEAHLDFVRTEFSADNTVESRSRTARKRLGLYEMSIEKAKSRRARSG